MGQRFKTLKQVGIGLLGIILLGQTCSKGVSSNQIRPGLKKFGSFQKIIPPKYEPIVILADKDNDPFCSGTVIDNHYILTAAHCLVERGGEMSQKEIHILDMHGRDTHTKAVAGGVNLRMDYGIVTGEFQSFKFAKIDPYSMPFTHKTNYVACGFPMGQHSIFCTLLQNIHPFEFQFSAYGYLVPGMSGGPVFDASNDTVIAVNSAAEGTIPTRQPSNMLVSPIVGLFGAFQIEPDYKEQ